MPASSPLPLHCIKPKLRHYVHFVNIWKLHIQAMKILLECTILSVLRAYTIDAAEESQTEKAQAEHSEDEESQSEEEFQEKYRVWVQRHREKYGGY
ncbi:hypothetical protein RUND412_006648 [Rhizina undulata]